MKSLKSQNYYEVLGLTRSASPEDIRNAYEVSRHTFQDDSLATYSLFTDEENQEILALISRAYETLFNPELRREYDGFLDKLEREGTSVRDVRPAPPPRPPRSQAGPVRLRGSTSQGPVRPGPQRPARDPVAAPPPQSAQPAVHPAAPQPPPPPPAEAPPVRRDEAAEKYIQSVSCFTGPVLKKIRQLRGFSREDIAERTKIRKTYIEYLEEEEFRFLPAPVYIKGFVSMIAGLLELPAQRVADDYMAYYRGKQDS